MTKLTNLDFWNAPHFETSHHLINHEIAISERAKSAEPFGVEFARFVGPFVGVRAEEIALRLEQILRKPLGAIAVEVSERCAEGGRRDSELDGGDDCAPPIRLRLAENAAEKGIEHQVFEIGIPLVGFFDAVEKFGANDAAAAPDRGDVAEVELPIILASGGAEQRHALRVTDDF